MTEWRRVARRRFRRLGRHSDPVNLRAALWATRALTHLRADLTINGMRAVVPSPPRLPARGLVGVQAVIRRRQATCLERSLLLQSWLASHGQRHDVVIGVGMPESDFAAHAWLADYAPDQESAGFSELTRLPVRESGT